MGRVISNIDASLEKQRELIAIKRKDLKKVIYTGAVTLGLSIPIAVVDYIPLINNYVKNKELNPRMIGEVGVLIGTNVIINSVIRSFEHKRDMKALEKLITNVKRSNSKNIVKRNISNEERLNKGGSFSTKNKETRFRD